MVTKSKSLMAMFFVSFATAAPCASYDGLAADYTACTTSKSNTIIVQACSRLIKNAVKENETIGLFYGLRASANNDKKLNCHDAHKARKLIKNPDLKDFIQSLIKINC